MAALGKRLLFPAFALAGILLVFLWAYWSTLALLAETWVLDPNYSQGFLIPVIALGILIHRCRGAQLLSARLEPWGLALVALATVMRLLGAYFYVLPLDQLSLLPLLGGLCLLLGGLPLFERAWPAIAFLLFMIPIPRTLGGSTLIAGLQEVGTTASTFVLQTLGVTAYQEGNVIHLKEAELGVIEACSGLRMLMVFCALAAAVAILLPYGWKRRLILCLSAVPLALACNILRITVAGLASDCLGSEMGHFIFHDLAGWLMVPLAFALLGAEIWLLAKLFRPVKKPAPSVVLHTFAVAPRRSARPKSAPLKVR
jgi:exosortase